METKNIPSKPELREYLQARGLVSRDVAELLRVNARRVRYWLADESPEMMPWACWFALHTMTGGMIITDPELIGNQKLCAYCHGISHLAETCPACAGEGVTNK